MPKPSFCTFLLTTSLLLLAYANATAAPPPGGPLPGGGVWCAENILTIADGYPVVIGGGAGDNLSNSASVNIQGCLMASSAYRSLISTSTDPAFAAYEATFKTVWHYSGPLGTPIIPFTIANSSEAGVSITSGISDGANKASASILGITEAADDTLGHSSLLQPYSHSTPSPPPDPIEFILFAEQVICSYTYIHTVAALNSPGFGASSYASIRWVYILPPQQ